LPNDLLPKHKVTDSALCQARKKLKASAFKELNTIQVDHYYKHFETETWNNFRLLAIDGSIVTLPNSPEIKDCFGIHCFNPYKNISSLGNVKKVKKFDIEIKINGWLYQFNYNMSLI